MARVTFDANIWAEVAIAWTLACRHKTIGAQ